MVGAPAPSPPVLPPTLTGSGESFVILFSEVISFNRKFFRINISRENIILAKNMLAYFLRFSSTIFPLLF